LALVKVFHPAGLQPPATIPDAESEDFGIEAACDFLSQMLGIKLVRVLVWVFLYPVSGG
jgi:hypothetical protein